MHTIIAFDDSIENENKHLFQECSDNARAISVNNNIPHTLIDSSQLDKNSVNSLVSSKEKEDFIFAAFSHGDCNSLVCRGKMEPYLSNTINNTIFNNKVIYTYACESGKELGNILCQNGAQAFIGYTEEVWMTYESIESFADCATYGINAILEGRTLSECLSEMKEKYTLEYEKLLEDGDLQGAGFLLQSRNSLVLIQS